MSLLQHVWDAVDPNSSREHTGPKAFDYRTIYTCLHNNTPYIIEVSLQNVAPPLDEIHTVSGTINTAYETDTTARTGKQPWSRKRLHQDLAAYLSCSKHTPKHQTTHHTHIYPHINM